jgi:hypothetical protein
MWNESVRCRLLRPQCLNGARTALAVQDRTGFVVERLGRQVGHHGDASFHRGTLADL